ncbi:thiolase family protein [Cohaesibacter celericrescens]|uniref:Acetyl-CoA C-acyltransferase n=1 Tax=Cohaesibacter celericrescens TaxID=2067669 RepID=A0A2N5XKJ6_9HYPH|nr:thiolase family protein [Cohaesibacter celericrescens]PLW75039.1 acetyl-CoA C-acyltransferase [Cohaesibacter celericrescens]
MTRSYIVAARRSAVAPRNGALAALELHDLAAPVVKAVLSDAGVDQNQVSELIVSNGLGAGGNPARLVGLAAGLPHSVAGLSVDRQCCGGLDAVLLADAMIRSGLHEIVVAGGVESYSRRPLRSKTFADGSAPQAYDQAPFTPWPDRDPDMAQAADRLANLLNITQAEQDNWAVASHQKAQAAEAITAKEIVPISGAAHDSFTRRMNQRLCARAPVVYGSVTAANMSVAADAAAFCVIVSERVARFLPSPSIEIVGGATLGGDPALPGLAPVAAIRASLDAAGLTPQDLDLAEIMEAFAVQAIACQRGAHINEAIVNMTGGSLARGHPIGASGAILAVRLYHALATTDGTGLAAIAAAGGIGTSLIVKSPCVGL